MCDICLVLFHLLTVFLNIGVYGCFSIFMFYCELCLCAFFNHRHISEVAPLGGSNNSHYNSPATVVSIRQLPVLAISPENIDI